MSTKALKWLPDVQDSNYPAAASYLTLLLPASDVESTVAKLKAASLCKFKAKDIFRASGLSLLGISNSHVEKDRQKIKDGTSLSPILLVRGDAFSKVIVADGYHRLCAVYSIDEDALIPCKIV
jgi:hypothetical protein